MSIQPAPDTMRTPDDHALQAAWRRFIDYDKASDNQKQSATNIRRWIMVLGLAATCLAVAMTYKDSNPIIGFLEEPLHWTLVIVPILMAGLMTYAMQFAPSISWLSYRIGAELIRREIYLYRMRAGDYQGKGDEDAQQTLLDKLLVANKEVNKMGVPAPYMQTVENIAEIVQSKTNDPKDNGFSPMSPDDYIAERVVPQRDWYVKRSRSDYQKLKQWRILMLAVAGAGTALAAFRLEPFVAVSTAVGTTIATYMALKMYGQSYPIYHPTAETLQIEMDKWSILLPEQRSDPAQSAALVKRIEDVFQSERDQWAQRAIQTQTNIDQSLMKSIGDRGADTETTPTIGGDTALLVAHTNITTSVTASASSSKDGEGSSVMDAAVNLANQQLAAVTSAAPEPANDSSAQPTTADAVTTNSATTSDTTTVSTPADDAVPAVAGTNGTNGTHPLDHGDGSAG